MAKVIVFPKTSRFRGQKPFSVEKEIPVTKTASHILSDTPKRATSRPAYAPGANVLKVKAHPLRKRLISGSKKVGRGLLTASKTGYKAGAFVGKTTPRAFKSGYKSVLAHRGRKITKLEYLARKEQLRAEASEHKLRRVTAPEAIQSREREYELQRQVLGDIRTPAPRPSNNVSASPSQVQPHTRKYSILNIKPRDFTGKPRRSFLTAGRNFKVKKVSKSKRKGLFAKGPFGW